ncbi:2Fe-2S iron-sulfur cluster-binding protein [Herminiimonas contaminans]|uniref:2Fe-2S iron-sulfur cluster binding domain-containing protein n=1 Tax=Herminiimonas contaminans TaxID=1111140 RepID=A0ABS0EUV8_9BURK|nr:2Fe-2S iron-sulfur cluster-binding protein [Herminiimonas contaminans]MBF8178632.1 2Fe-2S iron-sulfur cluster binding domain-containing protein [Herminiimonas contaminans]
MANITYIEHSGASHVVEVEAGWSVMKGAVRNGIPGIEAECGGALVCGTCHVYVDEQWLARTTPPEDAEKELLESVSAPCGNSRLSCQMLVSPELDGLIVRMPEAQG